MGGLSGSVVVGNAVLQALTILPGVTLGDGPLFWLLVAASASGIVASLAAVLAVVSSRAHPSAGRWIAALPVALLLTVVVALAVVLSGFLLLVAVPFALVVAASWSVDGRIFAGFRVFARAPWRSILLLAASVGVTAVLWVGALLAGFFIAGWFSAVITWLAFGLAVLGLVAAWASLIARRS